MKRRRTSLVRRRLREFKPTRVVDLQDRVVVERIEAGFRGGRSIADIARSLGVKTNTLEAAIRRKKGLQRHLQAIFCEALPRPPAWHAGLFSGGGRKESDG